MEQTTPTKVWGIITVLGVLVLFTTPVLAHPGNTDSYGGHTCYTNCGDYGLVYDQYHFHNKKSFCILRTCYQPYFSGCKEESDYNKLVVLEGKRGGFENSFTEAILKRCRDEINANNQRTEEYNKCLINSQDEYNQCLSKQNKVQDELNQKKLDYLKLEHEAMTEYIYTKLDLICKNHHGLDSFYDKNKEKCACVTSTVPFNNKCVSYNESCQLQYGLFSYGDEKNCHCYTGFEFRTSTITHKLRCEQIVVNPQLLPSTPITVATSTIIFTTNTVKYATVKTKINIRQSASAKGKIMGVLLPGKKYEIVKEQKDWVEIKYNNKKGFVMKKLIMSK